MQAGGGRPMKQPRRGGRRNRMDNMRDPWQGGFRPPFDMPPFDPNNPLEAMMQMQAMGLPFPGMPDQFGRGFPGGGNQQHRRRPCPDFQTKGYCSRGSTCTYDHGNESIFPPNMMEQADGALYLCIFALANRHLLTYAARVRPQRRRHRFVWFLEWDRSFLAQPRIRPWAWCSS